MGRSAIRSSLHGVNWLLYVSGTRPERQATTELQQEAAVSNRRWSALLVLWRSLAASVLMLALSTPALAADASPTFSKDVSRIFQQKCQQCHQPNSIAPMSLI